MHPALDDVIANYTLTVTPDDPHTTEAFLGYLRDSGCSVIDSIKALMITQSLSLGAAKARVHLSTTWADMRETHDRFHDQLEQLAQDCANRAQRDG